MSRITKCFSFFSSASSLSLFYSLILNHKNFDSIRKYWISCLGHNGLCRFNEKSYWFKRSYLPIIDVSKWKHFLLGIQTCNFDNSFERDNHWTTIPFPITLFINTYSIHIHLPQRPEAVITLVILRQSTYVTLVNIHRDRSIHIDREWSKNL